MFYDISPKLSIPYLSIGNDTNVFIKVKRKQSRHLSSKQENIPKYSVTAATLIKYNRKKTSRQRKSDCSPWLCNFFIICDSLTCRLYSGWRIYSSRNIFIISLLSTILRYRLPVVFDSCETIKWILHLGR